MELIVSSQSARRTRVRSISLEQATLVIRVVANQFAAAARRRLAASHRRDRIISNFEIFRNRRAHFFARRARAPPSLRLPHARRKIGTASLLPCPFCAWHVSTEDFRRVRTGSKRTLFHSLSPSISVAIDVLILSPPPPLPPSPPPLFTLSRKCATASLAWSCLKSDF